MTAVALADGVSTDPRDGPTLEEHEVEEALDAGAALFDQGLFWEAHEAWEGGWHRAPQAERDFFQGLIHVAAACLHHRRGNAEGFEKQAAKMRRRLAPYAAVHRGVPLQDVLRQMATLPPPGEDTVYPRLRAAP